MTGKVLNLDSERATVALPAESVRSAGFAAGDELHVFAPGHPLLVLTRDEQLAYFAGSIAAVSVAELFGIVCSSMRTGTLTLEQGGVRKTLAFREGLVCHATSSAPDDRLGSVLWRHRMIDLAALIELEPLVKPGVRLGKLLTDRGLLTAAQLYKGMQAQVREVVLGLFTWKVGGFAFAEGAVEASVVKLADRARDLTLEGMARADELEALRKRFPAEVAYSVGQAETSDAHAAALAAVLDGRRSLVDAISVSRLGEYYGRRAMTTLEQVAALRRGPQPALPQTAPVQPAPTAAAPAGPVEVYERIFARLAEAMRTANAPVSVLNSFFEQIPRDIEPMFAGVRFGEDGSFPVAAVMANGAAHHEGALGRAKALDALDTLAMFAVFELRNRLSAEAGRRLARDVDKLQRGAHH